MHNMDIIGLQTRGMRARFTSPKSLDAPQAYHYLCFLPQVVQDVAGMALMIDTIVAMPLGVAGALGSVSSGFGGNISSAVVARHRQKVVDSACDLMVSLLQLRLEQAVAFLLSRLQANGVHVIGAEALQPPLSAVTQPAAPHDRVKAMETTRPQPSEMELAQLAGESKARAAAPAAPCLAAASPMAAPAVQREDQALLAHALLAPPDAAGGGATSAQDHAFHADSKVVTLAVNAATAEVQSGEPSAPLPLPQQSPPYDSGRRFGAVAALAAVSATAATATTVETVTEASVAAAAALAAAAGATAAAVATAPIEMGFHGFRRLKLWLLAVHTVVLGAAAIGGHFHRFPLYWYIPTVCLLAVGSMLALVRRDVRSYLRRLSFRQLGGVLALTLDGALPETAIIFTAPLLVPPEAAGPLAYVPLSCAVLALCVAAAAWLSPRGNFRLPLKGYALGAFLAAVNYAAVLHWGGQARVLQGIHYWSGLAAYGVLLPSLTVLGV